MECPELVILFLKQETYLKTTSVSY